MAIKNSLTIKRLNIKDYTSLKKFFKVLSSHNIHAFFHPHDFTDKQALKICKDRKDFYIVIMNDKEILGYGMLRGYSEGYTIPSLGICIHPKYHSLKLGQMLMMFLHAQARVLNSIKVRLKVYKNNTKAIHIYKKLGYKLTSLNKLEFIGIKDL